MERLTERHTYDRKNHISIDRNKKVMICSNFCTSCGKADCEDIRKALFKLAVYEDMQEKIEKRIEEIKAASYYPHNFTGQMVEDFEWVLSLVN